MVTEPTASIEVEEGEKPRLWPLLAVTGSYSFSFVAYLISRSGLPEPYNVLNKPGWALPDWSFWLLWTALHGALAFSFYRSSTGASKSFPAVWLGVIGLAAHLAWTYSFFGRSSYVWALVLALLASGLMAAAAVAAARKSFISTLGYSLFLAYGIYIAVLSRSIGAMNR